ncbi:MAG: sodium:calcium antiporter, partial [Pseudomonadota bacterium]
MEYIKIAGGLIALILAGDMLVRGSVSIAKTIGIPSLIIGLTVVAFGTSAPELVVGVDAVLTGASPLAIGNVVGSNIANILLVIGVPALITPVCCDAPKLTRNILVMLAASGLFIGLAFFGKISAWQGLVLLAVLA